jgi:hypothetical protein
MWAEVWVDSSVPICEGSTMKHAQGNSLKTYMQ